MSLAATLKDLRPSARRWQRWCRAEPALAGLAYSRFRYELRHGDEARRDQLLAALVRIAQTDPAAVEVVAACMWPGLRSLIGRYAPGLDPDDAQAIAVAGLVAGINRFPTQEGAAPEHVASWLLRLPKRHLSTAVAREIGFRERHTLSDHPENALAVPGTRRAVPGTGPTVPGIDLTAPGILHTAVSAGVLSRREAWLLWAVDDVGHSLRFAARRLDISYQAACKRHQRAAQRFCAWWSPDLPAATPASGRRSA